MARWFEHARSPPDGGLPIIAPAHVARHNSVGDCWVIFKGAVYDLSDFLLDHPGGDDLILQYAGQDVGHVMDDPVQHVHSNSAYLLLDDFHIGRVPDGYVAAPQAPAPPPAAPIAGRAAGAIFAEGNAAHPTPSLAPAPLRPRAPDHKPPPPPVPRTEQMLSPSASLLRQDPHTLPPQPPPTPPPPPIAAQPAPRIHRMKSTSFALGSSHRDKDHREGKESTGLNFLGYRFNRRK